MTEQNLAIETIVKHIQEGKLTPHEEVKAKEMAKNILKERLSKASPMEYALIANLIGLMK